MAAERDRTLDELLEAAYRHALQRFEKEVAAGERTPAEEIDSYRRKRRDYASLIRLGRTPDEAHELAVQLLAAHTTPLPVASRLQFEQDVARLLIRLYDAFIAAAQRAQGSR